MRWGCSVPDFSSTGHVKTLKPTDLARMLRVATDWLGVYREQVNAQPVGRHPQHVGEVRRFQAAYMPS